MEELLTGKLPAKNLHWDQVLQDLLYVLFREGWAALEGDLEILFRLLEFGVEEVHATAVILVGNEIGIGEELEIRPHRALDDVNHLLAILVFRVS